MVHSTLSHISHTEQQQQPPQPRISNLLAFPSYVHPPLLAPIQQQPYPGRNAHSAALYHAALIRRITVQLTARRSLSSLSFLPSCLLPLRVR